MPISPGLYNAWLYSTGKPKKRVSAKKGYENKIKASLRKKLRRGKLTPKQYEIALYKALQGEDRKSIKYWNWRRKVLGRDKWTCRECNRKSPNVKVEAHHIKEWAYNRRQRFNLNNGKTLCIDCHTLIHPWRDLDNIQEITDRIVKVKGKKKARKKPKTPTIILIKKHRT